MFIGALDIKVQQPCAFIGTLDFKVKTHGVLRVLDLEVDCRCSVVALSLLGRWPVVVIAVSLSSGPTETFRQRP
eukprot:8476636-Lingulodinium_polyedra.AAC.1